MFLDMKEEDKNLNEWEFLDKITSSAKKLAKRLSGRSNSIAKMTGLRKSTYDEDIKNLKKEVKSINTSKQKSDFINKVEIQIKALERAREVIVTNLKSDPHSDELKYLSKGAAYYIDEFKDILARAEKIDTVKKSISNKKIMKYDHE